MGEIPNARGLYRCKPGHILSRIYNCTKHDNRPIEMQKLHILHYNFDFTTAQIVINCTLKYALVQTHIYNEIYAQPYFHTSVKCALYCNALCIKSQNN